MRRQIKGFRSLFMFFALCASSSAMAAIIELDFSLSFGANPATGPAPWIEAEFDDSVGDDSAVRLTVRALGSLNNADVTELYFNIAPGISLDSNNVSISYNAALSTGPDALSILFDRNNAQGENPNLRAGGDGFFNILLNLPTASGSRFNQGEVLVFDIVRNDGALTALDFFALGAPGPGVGNPGPFYAAAKLQETGDDGNGSDWVGVTDVTVVPLPAAGWLLLSSLSMLVYVVRRRRS